MGCTPMPIHPYDPSGEDEDEENAPDLGDVIRRILDAEGNPNPTAVGP